MIHHEPTKFTISLQKNIETFKEQLDHTTELTVRMNRVGRLKPFTIPLINLDDLVNADVFRDFLITPLFIF